MHLISKLVLQYSLRAWSWTFPFWYSADAVLDDLARHPRRPYKVLLWLKVGLRTMPYTDGYTGPSDGHGTRTVETLNLA